MRKPTAASPSPVRAWSGVLVLLGLVLAAGLLKERSARAAANTRPAVILMTADTEGHVAACATCPTHRGLGGLDRRATALAQARSEGAPSLLVDAGNWLAGPESIASRGEVIVAAYGELKYDVVHLTTKDLYWGKDATLALLKKAPFDAVSTNLVDEQSGNPLVAPYVVKTVGAEKVAVLGACEPPVALDSLPQLRQQLAGVRVRPPVEALAEWLPKAKAESDRVLVLYHGSGRGLRAVRSALGGSGAVVLAGGIRPENLPPATDPAVIATDLHGKAFARASLQDGKVDVAQVPITPDLARDDKVRQLVASYASRPAEAAGTGPATVQTVPATTKTVPDVKPSATEPGSKAPAGQETAVARPSSSGGLNPFALGGVWKKVVGGSDTPSSPPKAPPVISTPAEPPLPPPVVTQRPVVTKAPPPARIAAKQPQEPKGLAAVGLTGDQVNAAIDRGAAFLRSYFNAREAKGQKFGAESEYDLFYALALVKAGAHKRFPEFDAALRDYLPKVRPENIGVYGSAVLCLLLESYGDPDYYPLLNQSARYLFEGQSAEGSWQYYPKVPDEVLRDPRSTKVLQVWGGRPTDGSPAERWARQAEPDRHEGGDNSVTQYAVLGLHAAAREGVEIPAETWKRVLDLYKSRQNPGGSWGYVTAGSAESGSMTCAGLYALAVARFHLGQAPHAEDEAIERGLAWLSEHFTVAANPPANTANHYYYLYSLERAGRTLETEFVGPHEWYPQGARFLVDAQKEDGRWVEPGPYETKPELSTSFALLFLTRGTSALTAARPTGGNGVLKTAGVEPAPPRVYFIFDCSGSMLDEENGRQRFDAAREALGGILGALPPRTQVALRVYGHRKTARQPGADEDTELLVPMGPMDRADLSRRVQRLRARGKTPLALSLDEAAKDLTGAGKDSPCAVVLITDGGEDTMPRRDPVASAEALGRMPGVALHVVGFDIGRDDWGKQLRAMARAGHGRYWPASGGDALRRELRAALLRTPEQFVVADAAGKRFDGTFGKPLALPEGKYTLVTAYGGKEFAEPLWVNTGATTAVMFDAGKAESARGITAKQSGDDTPPPTVKPKFCSHCGAKLAAGAKFCTNCGQKVSP